MIESTQLYFFILAAAALLLAPGSAVLYITARNASQGRTASTNSRLLFRLIMSLLQQALLPIGK